MKGWDGGKRAIERERQRGFSAQLRCVRNNSQTRFGPFAGSLCSFFLFVAAIRLEPFKMVTMAEGTWTELSCRLQGFIYLAGLFSAHSALQLKKPKSQILIYCMYGATAGIYSFGCRWRESELVSE